MAAPFLAYLSCQGDQQAKLRIRSQTDHRVHGLSAADLSSDDGMRANFEQFARMTQDCFVWATMADGRRAIENGYDMLANISGAPANGSHSTSRPPKQESFRVVDDP